MVVVVVVIVVELVVVGLYARRLAGHGTSDQDRRALTLGASLASRWRCSAVAICDRVLPTINMRLS